MNNFDFDFDLMMYSNTNEANNFIGKLYDPLLNQLPSKNSAEFRKMINSFGLRQKYISKFGYIALTKELMEEIVSKFHELKIDKFLELEAGSGFFTKVLTDYGFIGTGITLDIPEDPNANHWGLQKTEIYDYCLNNNILVLSDIRKIEVNPLPEMVITSWIPYGGGQEVISFFEKNGLPNYYTIIGEGRNGCTASDNFFDWVDDNFECIHNILSYESFMGINDQVLIYKRRLK